MDSIFDAALGSRRLRRILLAGLAAAAIALPAAADEPVVPIGGDVAPPQRISGDPPAYTEEARLAGIEGVVVVDAVIDEGGNVVEPHILKGLPMGLDRAALDTVATWQFDPATRRGTPVRVRFILSVNFRFDDDYDFGPAFALFLRRNPDFAALYGKRRFAEAFDLLDRWPNPGEPLLPLARAYVSLGERDPRAAWEWMQADPAPPPIEFLRSVASLAGRLVVGSTSLDYSQRADYLEVALEAATQALENDQRDPWALVATARLLRVKVWLGSDAARNEAMLAEAQSLEARAEALGGLPPEFKQ